MGSALPLARQPVSPHWPDIDVTHCYRPALRRSELPSIAGRRGPNTMGSGRRNRGEAGRKQEGIGGAGPFDGRGTIPQTSVFGVGSTQATRPVSSSLVELPRFYRLAAPADTGAGRRRFSILTDHPARSRLRSWASRVRSIVPSGHCGLVCGVFRSSLTDHPSRWRVRSLGLVQRPGAGVCPLSLLLVTNHSGLSLF